MKKKIYIDGSVGTTGLRIYERFENRDDIELLIIDPELRKDKSERKKLMNSSDITFLCLPDIAAREAVPLVENENVAIIDASTAHRTEDTWVYGFPELSEKHRENIINAKRISVPGCHATGFISICYPLITGNIVPVEYPVSAFSLTGYSGGGKKLIAEYEKPGRETEFDAPREYALEQQHKHLKEMQKISGLARKPLFLPVVGDYYSGMTVSIPLYSNMLMGQHTPETIQSFFEEYYSGEKLIHVMPFGAETEKKGFLSGNACSGWDGMNIYVTGNDERILISSSFDNLGKGASGAAVQCMNLLLGCDETKGMHIN